MGDKQPIYLLGDLHGKFEELFRILKQFEIRDCHLLCVGDVGIGFAANRDKEIRQLNYINEWMKGRDITFAAIRGNHDNPDYFDGSNNLSHCHLLPDYSTMMVGGQTWQFVGGALSIDRVERIVGRSYWLGEGLNLNLDKVQEVDVLVTHSAPNWIGPGTQNGIVQYWAQKDPTLIAELVEERRDLDTLYAAARPKYLYAGHFHESSLIMYGETRGRILNELELYEHQIK